MAAKYDEATLEQLYGIALEQGMDALETGERMALGRWCRRTGRPRPDHTGAAPASTVETPSPAPAAPAVVEAASSDPVEAGLAAAEAEVADDLDLLHAVRFLDDWPADILAHGVKPGDTRWVKVARALRRFKGRPAVVADGLTRERARCVRYRLRSGRTLSFRPAGAFRAETAPDPQHPGLFMIVASYEGDAR